MLIASRPIITKEVTNMYIKGIRFMADMHRIYIKLHDVKGIDWHTGAYTSSINLWKIAQLCRNITRRFTIVGCWF